MKSRTKRLIVAAISGIIAGNVGAFSGSRSFWVISIVSAVTAVIVAWAINGVFKK